MALPRCVVLIIGKIFAAIQLKLAGVVGLKYSLAIKVKYDYA